ncbi:MAG: aconitate hydratase AcnA [Phycisphaeraceae bacterium]|nr:aconitate hydratase AcnA [Phycisphaeraceae bacterium]
MSPAVDARITLQTPLGDRVAWDPHALEAPLGIKINRLPYSIRILLEAALRRRDGYVVTDEHIAILAGYDAKAVGENEIPFTPGRVVLQDFTGVPAVVDLAAMRAAMHRMTSDPAKVARVNPLVPCDLVIDHSVQVDAFASGMALTINSQREFERNTERYQFLKWGRQAFDNFRVVPPATGIVHQVNLEYLAKVVWEGEQDGQKVLFPDSLVGTDSHTTMINGLGVLGWGVGGIEAEAVMLGQPIYMLVPEVVGFRLTGKLPEGATATDLVLKVTQMLRAHGVVGKFVEFHGPGLAAMPLANRATIANMAPEYGATMGFFPVDKQTLAYLRLTGRDEKLIETVETYCRKVGLWRNEDDQIIYSDELELDMSTVAPAMAGPRRPQDRVELTESRDRWLKELAAGFGKPKAAEAALKPVSRETSVATLDPDVEGVETEMAGRKFNLRHGDVVIAAITSCTNTSNPEVMLAAGLVARKARKLGLTSRPWVKTSLAPGSKVVTEYYRKSGLEEDLDALGFNTVGYGCTTCIGNSGPLPDEIAHAVEEGDLVVCSVLSGNRNFEGRVNPHVRANYLASPPLVVAYAIAGTMNIDLTKDPVGSDRDGRSVMLKDIWPTQKEVADLINSSIGREQFEEQYASVFEGSQEWRDISTSTGKLFEWDERSTYIQEPPFFGDLSPEPSPIEPISGARCLAVLGDSVTTDHISPAGAIKKDSPAGKFLIERGVSVAMFNSYGSRRGNDRVMTRGTFANIRVRNQLAPGTEGGVTTYLGPDYSGKPAELVSPLKTGEVTSIFEASVAYRDQNTPLVVLAGKDYGMGSSRDWAAKGTFLLGVKAVIAESFERIHRSNLVGMGVLPLCFEPGQSASVLGLTGHETFEIPLDAGLKPRVGITVRATRPDGEVVTFNTICRIDTPVEVDYYRNGGILHTVLRRMAAQ